jgi:hypothetical protein
MSPSEQIAKLIRSGLGGTAEIIGRQMTSEELQTGGYVQGIHYDPVTLLIRALEQRFGELEEETRMAAANEFQSFRKHQGESFEAFMCRYEISRERARRDGELEQTAEQCAQQIVRCLGLDANDIMQLISPYGNRLPKTEAELAEMIGTIRRISHITEVRPNNVVYSIRGPMSPEH